MRKIKLIILYVCFTVAAFLPAAVYASITVGQAVPALEANELDGKSFDLEDLKGKVVILHYWATWCPSCKEEMPVLDAIYQKDHDKGLEVLAISADRPHTRDDVIKAVQVLHFPAAMLSDTKLNGFDQPQILPITYVIDKQGILRNILKPDETPLTQDGLSHILDRLLTQ